MRFISYFSIFFFVPIFFISTSLATEELPSQKARFEGMGATFKAKKKDASGKINTEISDNKSDSSTYFKVHTFVVNVIDQQKNDTLTFLTLEIYCKINESADKWLIGHHMAAIKDTIITYTSGLKRQVIQTQKQKKTLQKELTLRVAERLKNLSGKKVISDLYLTRILIQ